MNSRTAYNQISISTFCYILTSVRLFFIDKTQTKNKKFMFKYNLKLFD